LLAVGMLAGLGQQVAGATSRAPAADLSRLVGVTIAPRLASGDRVLGRVAATAQVSGAVALKPRDEQAITTFIQAVSDPHSALYHQYLSKGQYAARFGPSAAAVQAVRRTLVADGLKISSVSSNNLLVAFRGSATRVEAAFHTNLERVRLANGTMGQATTSAVRLPASIAGSVQAVVGLDNLVHEMSTLAKSPRHVATPLRKLARTSGGPVACPAAQELEIEGALTDQEVSHSYGASPLYAGGDLGQGQTVDIYELEPFSMSDIRTFDECYFDANHTSNITVTNIDGGPGTGPGSGEAALDVEDVSAFAPDAHIHVFSGPNSNIEFGNLDTWNAIAVADDARAVSSSWALCEEALQTGSPGEQQVENEVFQQTAAQGQSVFASSGDDGSDACANHNSAPTPADLSVLDPASQPYVVSVGGTTILNPSEPPVETVWNNGTDGGGSGGGISETWAMPSWQAGFIKPAEVADEACSNDPTGVANISHVAGDPTTLTPGTPCREAPDVSALADPQSGITIFQDGQWFPIGGTSSSAPMWAAMTAEINDSPTCSTAPLGVGFVSPLLYQVAASSPANYANAFSDVTIGNNDNLGVGNGTMYSATAGYDLATGLGTPRLTDANGHPGLAEQLCDAVTSGTASAPAVSGLAPDSEPIAGGAPVTISGTNFGATKGSVFFGNLPATVTSWSATSITVTAPPYDQPQGTIGTAGGSADVTVATASPSKSSSPGESSVFHFTGGTSGSPEPIVDYSGPMAGPVAGGNTVTIVGSGFEEAGGVTGVTFGGLAGSAVHVINDNELTVAPPAQTGSTVCATATTGICQVQVVVSNGSGPSVTQPILPAYTGPIIFSGSAALELPPGCGCEEVQGPTEYDYAPRPTITSESPNPVSSNGGTSVAITGTGFSLLDFQWVNVGPAGPASSEDFNLEAITPTEIDVVFPGDPNGTLTSTGALRTSADPVDISVQTGGGLSAVSPMAFAGTPIVTSLSKHLGAVADPGQLTITGKGFDDADLVVFVGQGGNDFIDSTTTHFVVHSDTSMTVQVPEFFAIPTDTLVCSITACSAIVPADAFVFAYPGRPIVDSVSPSHGPAHGGTLVTIQGRLDSEPTAVHFGSQSVLILDAPFAGPSGPIIVVSPIGMAGRTVNVTVTTPGGVLAGHPTSATTSVTKFTFTKSTPSAPQDVVAKAGKHSVRVTWQRPATNGGSAILHYIVRAESKGIKTVTIRTSPSTRSVGFLGLKAGVPWTVVVIAKSALGLGLRATSSPVTPTA
jgi:hypothetical protein